jgi:signal transduction histidine kinase
LIRNIDDLLDISRVNSGKVLLYKSKSDVIQSIEDIMNQMKPLFEARHQKLSFEHKDRSIIAVVDEERLKMAIENILDNACKYTPEGWCRVRDSNPRRLSQMIYSHPCLTASLTLHICVMEPTEGFEPTTRCLQNSRSSH